MIVHLQAAKRRASGDAMKRLIEEEEERKRLRRAEEEAERIAQEKARQEMEERQKRELEERRKALAKKRAEVEEKNRQLEVRPKNKLNSNKNHNQGWVRMGRTYMVQCVLFGLVVLDKVVTAFFLVGYFCSWRISQVDLFFKGESHCCVQCVYIQIL